MNADIHAFMVDMPHALTLAGAIIVIGFFGTHFAFRGSPVGQFICQFMTFAGLTSTLMLAAVVPFRPTPAMDLNVTYVIISLFKIIWWLAASWLFAGFVRAALVFKRRSAETRFLQDLCAGFIYVGAILGIVAYVFDIPVTGLLAASGVVAIVIGLALQNTLGDVFSGVVLNLAKPYRPGDWVVLDNSLEGRVIETNWRATQILTLANDIAIIPNSIIAKSRLINASQPIGAHGITVSIRFDPAGAPSGTISVLETALLGCDKILRHPTPSVTIRSLDAVALECEVQIFVALVEQSSAAQNEVFDRIFRHCAAAGLRLAPPAGSAAILPARNGTGDPINLPMRMLERLPIFASLSAAERLALATTMVRHVYKTGDVLVEQGIIATHFFILATGVLAAVQLYKGSDVEVLRLAPGDCFGQASAMTAKATTFKVRALTRCVVLEIGHEDMAALLKANPGIATELEQLTLRREKAADARLKPLQLIDDPIATPTQRMAARVRNIFSFP
jgi:small-conductance mechanosensitive channel/CRP-like cAMP-binding protein